MYLTGRLVVDHPTPALADDRLVFAVLSSGDSELAWLGHDGWRIDSGQAIQIGSVKGRDLCIVPVRRFTSILESGSMIGEDLGSE